MAFDGCLSLKDIYTLRDNPEEYQCDNKAFTDVPEACTLHVPAGSKEAYASTEPWNYFRNIVEDLNTTAIAPITIGDGKDGHISTYYDLHGQRVKNPSRGIFIINGKKVFR